MIRLRFQRLVAFALCLAAGLVASAHGELIVNADLDPSQIGPLTTGESGIAIPLPNFTLSGTEDTLSIRFTNDQALRIVVPNGTNNSLDVALWGVTDGGGTDAGYSGGLFYLTDAQHQPIPNTTSDVQFANAYPINSMPSLYIASHLTAPAGTVFQFSDLHLTGSQPYDAANITGAILQIFARADVSDGGPPYPAYGSVAIVPEPASLALLGAAGLMLLRRRTR